MDQTQIRLSGLINLELQTKQWIISANQIKILKLKLPLIQIKLLKVTLFILLELLLQRNKLLEIRVELREFKLLNLLLQNIDK